MFFGNEGAGRQDREPNPLYERWDGLRFRLFVGQRHLYPGANRQAIFILQINHPDHIRFQKIAVQQLQAFYVHAGVFAGGMLIIFLVNLATNAAAGTTGEWSAWWSAWALIGWGLGIAVHGLVVRLNRPARSSSSWTQQHIDKGLAR